MTWELKHSVIAKTKRQFAWQFWTNVENWTLIEGPDFEFRLDGPFETGTQGTTKVAGQDPRHWKLVEVKSLEVGVIEVALPDAIVSFALTFEDLPYDQTRISQHITLRGPGAEQYVALMESQFAKNIGAGMEKLAAAIESYAATPL